MIFLLLGMLITFVVFPTNADKIFIEGYCGLISINLLLAWRLVKIHWSVALCFSVLAVSTLAILTFPQIYHRPVDPFWILKLSAIEMRGYATLILFATLPFLLTPEFFKATIFMLLLAAILDSFWIIARVLLYGQNSAYAILGNPAMDASFLATMLPLIFWGIKQKFYKTSLFNLLIVLIAIVLTKSSTGIGGVGVALAAFLLVQYGRKALLVIFPAALGISFLAYIYLKDELLNPNGRYSIWQMAMKFFMNETNIIWGAGSDSFYFWGPEIQTMDAIEHHVKPGTVITTFFWMHNDWLQTLFENGILGLLALTLLFLCLLKFSWAKKNALFPMICTFGFVALTQMPFHLWPFQILGVSLIVLAFTKEELII